MNLSGEQVLWEVQYNNLPAVSHNPRLIGFPSTITLAE